jgi:hypothetical protein
MSLSRLCMPSSFWAQIMTAAPPCSAYTQVSWNWLQNMHGGRAVAHLLTDGQPLLLTACLPVRSNLHSPSPALT